MKKLFVVIIMIAGASQLMAQSTFTVGPRVGLNYTKITSDDQSNVDYEHIRTWSAGAFARANLGRFYVQPEAYFNTKGSNIQIRQDPTNPASQNINGRIRLSSLDTPLLLGYKLAEGKRRKSNFRVYAGPVASFVLKEKENDLKLLNENSYEFNKSNIGIQTGLGFDLGNLTFDARYETGLNLINSYFNQRAKVFQLSVGIKLF